MPPGHALLTPPGTAAPRARRSFDRLFGDAEDSGDVNI
jgi:hypothetical protein